MFILVLCDITCFYIKSNSITLYFYDRNNYINLCQQDLVPYELTTCFIDNDGIIMINPNEKFIFDTFNMYANIKTYKQYKSML